MWVAVPITQRLAEAEGAVNLDRPEGFEDNNGRVRSLIPVSRGLEVVPKWIQKRNDGKVGVTALEPLVIPEQLEGEWFDALADTPVIATPLETLEWLRGPDSPS